MSSPETEIRALLEGRSAAFHDKDIDQVMSLYADEVVYFDLVPPLRYTGAAALRGRFLDWFERWKSPIGQEFRDVSIVTGGDVAAAHMLIRTSGTLKDGREVGYWVRTSNACRRLERGWRITHEHVSLPVDMKSRQAVMNLTP